VNLLEHGPYTYSVEVFTIVVNSVARGVTGRKGWLGPSALSRGRWDEELDFACCGRVVGVDGGSPRERWFTFCTGCPPARSTRTS